MTVSLDLKKTRVCRSRLEEKPNRKTPLQRLHTLVPPAAEANEMVFKADLLVGSFALSCRIAARVDS
jgi:hypothetical protein